MKKHYLVFVTGGTDPSLEEVETHEAALTFYCRDRMNNECTDEDSAFVLVIENGEPTLYPFGSEEVERRIGFLEEVKKDYPDHWENMRQERQ